MKKKGSCLKRLGIGCASVIGLFFILGLIVVVGAKLNQPKSPRLTTLNSEQSFGIDREGRSLNLGDEANPPKPIRLNIEAEAVFLRVVPGNQSGKIELTGDYDEANFELSSDVKEKEDHIDYRVRFKSKVSFLGMVMDGASSGRDLADKNKLVIHLPKDIPLRLVLETSKGRADVDLSGLSVVDLDLGLSMGDLDVSMSEPNPIEMNRFTLRSSFGGTEVLDIQNFRFAHADVRGRMGEVKMRNSGPFLRDAELNIRYALGEVDIAVSDNVSLDATTAVILGSANVPGNKQGYDAKPFNLKVNGGVTMGELSVSRKTRYMPISKVLIRQLQNGDDVADVISEYRRLKQDPSVHYFFDESQLNSVGYYLIGRKRFEEAIAVFKLNVEVYENYANGYDSLAEGYDRNGNREAAIANYEKALVLDPGNRNARARLAELRGREP